MKHNLIAITGIPGTGKTTIGNFLQDHHGFKHIDVEKNMLLGICPRELNSFKDYINQISKNQQTVLSWGAAVEAVYCLNHLVQIGCKLIWFDGDRVSAFRVFMQREQNNVLKEFDYHLQLLKIIKHNLIEKTNPRIINPFDALGKFKDKQQIVEEILRA